MLALVIACDGECVAPTLESMHRHARELTYCRWEATTPDQVDDMEQTHGIRWAYPDYGTSTLYGLKCHAYRGDKMKRRAVFWSHWTAWKQCAEMEVPVIVMESDALFIRDFSSDELDGVEFGMVSLNDPRGATREAARYHDALQFTAKLRSSVIVEAPWVDAVNVPQGLPGHSAYALFPWFAKGLIASCKEYGAWPNDALCNKQFFPDKLGCLTNYATRVSGRPSTI